jgi:hypothetical protein
MGRDLAGLTACDRNGIDVRGPASARPKGDLTSVGRPGRLSVLLQVECDLPGGTANGGDDPDVRVSATVGRERNQAAIGRPRWFGIHGAIEGDLNRSSADADGAAASVVSVAIMIADRCEEVRIARLPSSASPFYSKTGVVIWTLINQ